MYVGAVVLVEEGLLFLSIEHGETREDHASRNAVDGC